MFVIAIVCPKRLEYIDYYDTNNEDMAIYLAVKDAYLTEYCSDIDIKHPGEHNEDRVGFSYLDYCSSEIEGYILTKRIK